jgi:DNA-directed RNA polymerase alpha subunit
MALYNAVNLTSQIPTFSIQKQKDGIQIGDSTYGCFRIGPFKSTKSLTFANLLRRTLLHEIPGTGITQVTFQLPTHEFSTLPGVQESVIDILLNLKQIVFQGYCGSYTRGTLCKQGPATITANDLQLPYPLIVNSPNQSIAHVSSGFEFKMDFILKTAKGSSLPLLKKSVAASSSLLVQNDFNPIKKVNYTICEERLKEWIELEIWTNGSIQPYLALQTAVQNILCEFDSLYPKTLHLHSRILEYGEYKSKIENRNKLENSFFPIDLYTGLKSNQLLNFENLKTFQNWKIFEKKYEVSTKVLKPFF